MRARTVVAVTLATALLTEAVATAVLLIPTSSPSVSDPPNGW
ncbi:hypothetical protein [Nocardia sputi]|nr:hypothetical protein [Nocardia sputi]